MHTSRVQTAPSALRKVTSGKAGIAVGAVLLAASAAILIYAFRGRDVAEDAANRNFICAETGKSFAYTVKSGDSYPIVSLYTKNRTGWPAEKCYWTREGKAKLKPTLVLLNEYIDKPGPTLCPDCGHVVKPHNPPPPPELMEEAQLANRQE